MRVAAGARLRGRAPFFGWGGDGGSGSRSGLVCGTGWAPARGSWGWTVKGEIGQVPASRVDHRGVVGGAGVHAADDLACRIKGQYLRFTVDLAVPATDNAAERDLRPIKTQVKISGCHASQAGAKNWLAVRSYIVTAIKQASAPST